MKKHLVLVLTIIIIVPLVLFFVLALRLANQEELYIRERFSNLFQARLQDIILELKEIMAGHERMFLAMQEVPVGNTEEVREVVRDRRFVRQIFLLDPDGKLEFPPGPGLRTEREDEFFVRTRSVWDDGESFFRPWEDSHREIRTHGWYTWFWGKRVNLIFWMLRADGRLLGIEVDDIALVADIIGSLPDSGRLSPTLTRGRIRLSDITGEVLYQWGAYTPVEGEDPFLRMPVASPLDGWELAYFLPEEEFASLTTGGNRLAVMAAGGLAVLLLAFLGIYFYRENTRALREAASRVTFVNQVSHELKTPLTNIRLYAELLEAKLDPDEDRLNHYLAVIVSESRRLSRLILNVLTFSREQKQELKLRKSPGVVDEVIRQVILNYSQSFSAAGIEVFFDGNAGREARLDSDVLEQILNNLFSNVEKYAAAGGELRIDSRLEGSLAVVTVADRGGGIPRDKEEKIFRPFYRLSHKLSDGVTGTGLGLTIARSLARLHGGELCLEAAGRGACFRLTLDIR